MRTSTEEKRAEAVLRMKRMGVCEETINQFEQENLVSTSEPPHGVFYWVTPEERQVIREFEAEHDALVYLVIRSYTTIGQMDSYLYISDDPDEWEDDRRDIDDHEALAYVRNIDDPWCSELGRIGFRLTVAGGLARTW